MLDVQVDEFTLVLQPTKRPSQIEGWGGMEINIINEFVILSKLEDVLGNLIETTYSLPQGYSNGFICDDAPYYFAIAFHTDFIQMGICIKFSAHAWMQYRKQYESLFTSSIQIHQFFTNINNSSLYTSRLSRIDIAIDFINEKVNVNTIYNQLSKKIKSLKLLLGEETILLYRQ